MTRKAPTPSVQPLKPEDAAFLAQLVQRGLQGIAEDASRILNSLPVEKPEPQPEEPANG